MQGFVLAVNTAAMVLGYILFAVLFTGLCWLVGVWYNEWSYRRARRRKHDIQWDNIRSAWLLDMQNRKADVHDITDRIDTDEYPRTVVDSVDRINTDVMEMTLEQIVNYQREYRQQ